MLKLIKKIDKAWNNKIALYGIHPNDYNGYFQFRNKIIIKREVA